MASPAPTSPSAVNSLLRRASSLPHLFPHVPRLLFLYRPLQATPAKAKAVVKKAVAAVKKAVAKPAAAKKVAAPKVLAGSTCDSRFRLCIRAANGRLQPGSSGQHQRGCRHRCRFAGCRRSNSLVPPSFPPFLSNRSRRPP